ncbi:hypothetical protein ACFX13_017941 [Malus domestica]|uniref:fasciclin-like arabinogalactan protein 13 n=1 Tax=Malus domestica TaxID=3750 RepID=UPI0010AAFDD7|nr:fasciclin-like arabinogalactan protein 13 [Malus domestica]
MASTPSSSLLLTAATVLLLLLISHTQAQTAPAPSPAGPLNFTGLLDKNGQYSTFIRLLISTQVANQITNQLNSSTEGLTVFAPTDNAFDNLKAGTLNSLDTQQQVALVLYHVLPKYYTLASLLTVSNPVRTQATGQDGGTYGLNFTGSGNQVNVSTGIVETQINNALRQQFPLAVYQVDKVLLPYDLFGAKAPASAPPPSKANSGSGSANETTIKPASSPDNSGAGSVLSNVGFMGLALGYLFMGTFL